MLFADDTNIFASNHSYDALFHLMNKKLSHVNDWFALNYLSLNLKKLIIYCFTSIENLSRPVPGPCASIMWKFQRYPQPKITSLTKTSSNIQHGWGSLSASILQQLMWRIHNYLDDLIELQQSHIQQAVFGTMVQQHSQAFGSAKWQDILALIKLSLKSLRRLNCYITSLWARILKIGGD